MAYENIIDNFLRETGMAASTLAVLSGINRTKISQALRGQSSFTGPETLKLAALIEELRRMVRDLQPAPIDFTDCAAIQKILEHRRQGIEWKTVAVDGNDRQDQSQ